ncbi:MAG: hypothetical protein M1133_16380 [Armatimonadetes bacterium]|nr:hypothetical protein [Armatimonadota bacterium]
MGQTLAATLTVRARNTYTNALDLANVVDSFDMSFSDTLANGAGANQAQVVWHDRRSLLTTATEELDLAGALVNAFGTVTFTKIKGIIIDVRTVTTGYRLLIGGAAANAFETWLGAAGDKIRIDAGGMFCLTSPVDGYTVTAGTGDILKIDNPSGGTVEFDIYIIGTGSVA